MSNFNIKIYGVTTFLIFVVLVLSSFALNFVEAKPEGCEVKYTTKIGNKVLQCDDGSYWTETKEGITVPGRELTIEDIECLKDYSRGISISTYLDENC